MPLTISASFAFYLFQPTDLLMQFEAAATPEQRIGRRQTILPVGSHLARVRAKDGIGERIWLRANGACEVHYEAVVEVERPVPDLGALTQFEPHDLPGEAVEYLFESRYCQSGAVFGFVCDTFAGLRGGARVKAMRDWITANIAYRAGTSDAFTTALDTFNRREGICRDFAHVLVCFARASMIPARYVSCFAPGVKPQDFHALVEVYLASPDAPQGAWHMVDATGMADPAHTARIGVGRDAADVSFLTAFGNCRFDRTIVDVFHHQGDAAASCAMQQA